MTFVENSDYYRYDIVAKVFIELRNKGVSLSALDLDILNQWETNSLDPQFICQVMGDVYRECQKKDKPFPKTLLHIAQRVDKILLKMRET